MTKLIKKFAVFITLLFALQCYFIYLRSEIIEEQFTMIEQYQEDSKKINIEILDNNMELSYHKNNQHLVDKIKDFEHLGLLIEISNKYDYDWKFFLTQIYYESRFNSYATSKANAKGLLQLTRFVYNNELDPYDEVYNLFAGIIYYDWIFDKFKHIENKTERQKFALASYNFGITAIKQIQQNLKNKNINYKIYNNIESYLPRETKNYVAKITTTYSNFY